MRESRGRGNERDRRRKRVAMFEKTFGDETEVEVKKRTDECGRNDLQKWRRGGGEKEDKWKEEERWRRQRRARRRVKEEQGGKEK